MPAGDPAFEKDYTARQDIQEMLDGAKPADPLFIQFMIDYGNWIQLGRPTSLGDLVISFHGAESCRQALNAGDDANGGSGGYVLQVDVDALNKFVAEASIDLAAVLQSLGNNLPKAISGNPDDIRFKIALTKLLTQQPLTPLDFAYLKGCILARVRLESTRLGSGSDARLFAIPGYQVGPGEDLTDPFWRDIDTLLADALQKSGTDLVNLSGAVQFRLAEQDGILYPPIIVAPGLHIFGGA